MALKKISAGSDQYWLLNDIPHQRGQFDVSARIGEDVVEIYNLVSLKSLARGNYYEFSPDGITPYASTQALIDDLKAFFFRSVAGGGGGGVQGVTGDGVDNTNPANPVLTFPSANEVPNNSLIPGATTALALNELGVAISDNANNLNDHEIDTTNPHSTSVSNLNDVILATPQEGEILAFISGTWQNITSPAFNPTTSGVLTDYSDSQNNNTQTTNSTTGVTYLTLSKTGVDINSDYRFNVSFSISHDATNSNAFVDIKDFGVSILSQVYTVEPKDTNDRTWITLSGRVTPNPLGGGQFQIQLDFGTDDAADDTTMYFANISLQKIMNNGNYKRKFNSKCTIFFGGFSKY